MRSALRRRASGASGDVPVGALVLSTDGDEVGRGHNARERRLVSNRARGDSRAAGGRNGTHRYVATHRLHAGRHARAVHDVRRSGGAARAAPVWCTAPTIPRPVRSDSLWDVVRDRRLNFRPEVIGGVLAGGVRCTAAFVLRGASNGPVACCAVACPSGRRSTPRKRVRGQLLRGFKSHRHRLPTRRGLECASSAAAGRCRPYR